MKSRTASALTAICILLASVTAGCGKTSGGPSTPNGSEGSGNSHYPVEVVTYNYAGEETVTVYTKAPERVLAVYQGSIETMIALGLEDHVVASYGLDNEVKDEWKDGFSRMNYVDSSFAPDRETVITMRPDMIFSWGSLFGEKTLGDVDFWISRGTNTYMNSNTRAGGMRVLENEYTDILNIGRIFDVEDRAQALVNRMKEDVAAAKAAAGANDKVPTVAVLGFYDTGIRNYCLELAGDIVSQLGLTPMMSTERYMGKEDLVRANPNVIFVEYMPRPDKGGDAVRDEEIAKLTGDPALASLSAVRDGRVYGIMLGDIYAPAVRAGDGIRILAEGAYPGLFDQK